MRSIKLPEMKFQLQEKEKRLIFLLLVVVMVAVTMKFGYSDIKAKSQVLQNENMALTAQLTELNTLVAKQDRIIEETKFLEIQSQVIMSKYGAGIAPEKSLMFLEAISQQSGMYISDVSFGETSLVQAGGEENTGEEAAQVPPEEDTVQAQPEEEALPYYLYTGPVSVSYSSSYASLKQAIGMIANCPERINIESITVAYDANTGKLSGTITMNMYEMTGTGAVYYPPNLNNVPISKPNLFDVN